MQVFIQRRHIQDNNQDNVLPKDNKYITRDEPRLDGNKHVFVTSQLDKDRSSTDHEASRCRQAHCLRLAGPCKCLSHHISLWTKSPMVSHHLAVQVQGTLLTITTYLPNTLFGYQIQRPVGHAGKLLLSWAGRRCLDVEGDSRRHAKCLLCRGSAGGKHQQAARPWKSCSSDSSPPVRLCMCQHLLFLQFPPLVYFGHRPNLHTL